MAQLEEVLKKPLITEKTSIIGEETNRYGFIVDLKANKNQIDHWDIEDPVSKLVNKTKDQKIEIITKTFNNINQHINDWINFEK